MKKFKAILALLLVAALFCTLFAACGTSEESSSSAASSESSTNDSASTETSDSDETDADAETEEIDPEDIENIVVSYLDVAANETAEWDRLQDYINSITEPEIGVHVTLRIGQMAEYGTQIPLMIAGGEQLDVVNISPMGTTTLLGLMSTNSLLECKDLIETYAPTALEICGDFADSYYVDGGLYGLPTNRINATDDYIILRKDILDATGTLELAQNISTWSEMEELFSKVYDYCTENNIYVVGGQKTTIDEYTLWHSDEFTDNDPIDDVGERAKMVMVTDDGTVSCKWENEDLVDMMKRAVEWNNNGWVYPDTILGDDHVDNLYKQGVLFAYFNRTEIGVESARKLSSGYDVVCPLLARGIVMNSNLAKFGVGIPITSEAPEAAAKFIELLYTDSRIVTVFAWGIEGEDYVLNDEGEATAIENATYSYRGQDYMIGNQMLVPPWDGQGGDFRQQAEEVNKTAKRSPFIGFMLNSDGLDTLTASLTAVYDEYRPALCSGQYTDELHQEYIDKLYAVGLQDYMDEVQTQVSAFLASK